ncbi:hypothetical protein XOC_2212 [Xanthomonas oryzae pv. oryzicola BLS256]|uniref:Uncharacterized protein n=1 Tax=Xanthomonas oryzae pv. oryzicola (strain BLS256) TaxID=383407 RepID=G7TE24_XANOB|nr:hypothetical protein XOC_2212 [Xanthomonas oryzae pv. oryzicola BLS256]QEO97676.1 hypothetical protein XOCgx_2686 [Xanthomonas oryzae pv. oryzicola]
MWRTHNSTGWAAALTAWRSMRCVPAARGPCTGSFPTPARPAWRGIRQRHVQFRLRAVRGARPGHLRGAVDAGNGYAGSGDPRSGSHA